MSQFVDSAQETLTYYGCNFFRQRVVLATLFQKSLIVKRIREQSRLGLQRHEASLLHLMEKITDGSSFYIDVTGTELRYTPGCIVGGDNLFHDCGAERNVSYFLEALLLLAPFAKAPLSIRLKGITHGSWNDQEHRTLDPSVDLFRLLIPPLMKQIHADFSNLKLEVVKRSFFPDSTGEVTFFCPTVRYIPPFQLIKETYVKRVRGLAVTHHVSSQFGVRIIDRVRWSLNDLLADVWVYHVHSKHTQSDTCPGYGVTLVAETPEGAMKGVEVIHDASVEEFHQKHFQHGKVQHSSDWEGTLTVEEVLRRDRTRGQPPTDANSDQPFQFSIQEFIGVLAVKRLLMEIHQGGIMGTTFQHIPLLFMALAQENQLCQITMSSLTSYTVQFLRHLKDFGHVTFAIEEQQTLSNDMKMTEDQDSEASESCQAESQLPPSSCILLKCLGIGYRNLVKRTI